jgi:hypothetical protein
MALLACVMLGPAWGFETEGPHGETLHSKEPPGANKDPTDAATRHKKHTVGDKLSEWVRHLDDDDPHLRLEAVKMLGDSNDPKATVYLMSAVSSSDVRVSTAAVDYLGRTAAPEAASLLTEQLVYPGTTPMFRQHVLVALGKIADPETGPSVLDFLKTVSDPALRGAAIHALGEIGNPSTRGELQAMSAQETDPRMKSLMQDAQARIAERSIHQAPTQKGGTAIFTHSEGKQDAPESVK